MYLGCSVRTKYRKMDTENYVRTRWQFDKAFGNFLNIINEDIDEVYELFKTVSLMNYDLNMYYMKEVLYRPRFYQFLDYHFSYKSEFEEVYDLREYDRPGLYVMVLEEYNQIYVGITGKSIKKRIQAHWNKDKDLLNQVLGGDFYGSKISIDSYRVYDTTRIFVYRPSLIQNKDDIWKMEEELIETYPSEYMCNRLCGGSVFDDDIMETIKNMDEREEKGEDVYKKIELPRITESNISEIIKGVTYPEFERIMEKYDDIWEKRHELFFELFEKLEELERFMHEP